MESRAQATAILKCKCIVSMEEYLRGPFFMGNRILQVGGGGCDAMSIGANRKGQKNRDRSFFYFVEVRRPCDLLPTGPFPAPCQGQSPQSRCGNKAGGGGCGGSVACGVEVAARAVRCTALTVTQHDGTYTAHLQPLALQLEQRQPTYPVQAIGRFWV